MQLINIKLPRKKAPTTLFVCLECDRSNTRMGTPQAEGRSFYKALKSLFKTDASVQVRGSSCTGGCACRTAEQANSACSVTLAQSGKFTYVLRLLNPQKPEVLQEFVTAYQAHKTGLLTPPKGGIAQPLCQHLATRTPPTP